MNCEDVRKFSFTYLDGEFDGREKVEFESHVGGCCDCRQIVAGDNGIRDIIRLRLVEATPSCDLRDRLTSRLAYEQRKARLSRTIGVPLAMAAGVTLVFAAWRLVPDDGPSGAIATAGPVAIAPARAAHKTVGAAMAQPRAAAAPRSSDPKTVARPEARDRQAERQDVAVAGIVPTRPKRRARNVGTASAGDVRLASVAAAESTGEVLGGGLDNKLLTDKSPFGAVRSTDGLRAMVRAHAAPLPPEVIGPTRRVHAYLQRRIADIGPPPIAEGAGVRLLGARLGQLGSHPVVQYTYQAWGVPLSAIVHLRAQQPSALDDPSVVTPSPGDPRSMPSGLLLDRLAGYYLLHLVGERQVVTVISELGLPALQRLVAPQRFL